MSKVVGYYGVYVQQPNRWKLVGNLFWCRAQLEVVNNDIERDAGPCDKYDAVAVADQQKSVDYVERYHDTTIITQFRRLDTVFLNTADALQVWDWLPQTFMALIRLFKADLSESALEMLCWDSLTIRI
jgi:hypothetical protein